MSALLVVGLVLVATRMFPGSANSADAAPSHGAGTAGAYTGPIPRMWKYEENHDNIRGTTDKFATMTTDDVAPGDEVSASATLELRHYHGEYGVLYHSALDQFACFEMDGCRVTVRFDDGKAQYFTGRMPTDGDTKTMFLLPYGRFVASLRNAKTVLIETSYFQQGVKVKSCTVPDDLIWK